MTSQNLNPMQLLEIANVKFKKDFPGSSSARQSVHTVYGGAQIFTSNLSNKMSEGALKTLHTYGPTGDALAKAMGLKDFSPKLWNTIRDRVEDKLKREAVEDFRIDFEDGYGNRKDSEEDGHAQSVALEVAKGMKEGTLPSFIGIRIKPLNEENVSRSSRTLKLFLSTLLTETKGKLPDGFVVTLPKITIKEQSTALAYLLSEIETKHVLAKNTLKFELMVETPQSVIGADGINPLRSFVEAGMGRCIGAHFGTYDYTAGVDITAAHQTMANPVCDFAKHMMQVSLAGTGIMLSDGATNIMPIGPHSEKSGVLTHQQLEENREVVHRAWAISYGHIRHSLETGFYQGWDLHPAQLPVRYAAVYAFFLESYQAAADRLKSFIDKAAKATLLGEVFDDAATGQGLLNYFLRGLSSGAITEEEVKYTGLSIDEIRTRSFLKVLQGRKIV